MERKLSDEEQDFIQSFAIRTEFEDDSIEQVGVREEVKTHRRGVIFWWIIAILALTPFLISIIFFYMLNQYDSLVGSGGLKFLAETLNETQLQQMASETGIPEINTFVKLYNNRFEIVGLIFSLFAIVIACLIFLRSLSIYIRGRNG